MPQGTALTLLMDRSFRWLWFCVVLSFLGHFVHVIAAAWVMTDLTHSATMVALIQTAASLPMALLALISGGLADVFDRRRVMLLAQYGMLCVSVLLVTLSLGGLHSPASLLILVFFISLGSTVLVPAWQASIGDLVPREDLPEAVSLHTIGVNMIKTIGPFVGGIVLAAFGATTTFLMSTFGYLPAIFALSRWQPAPSAPREARRLFAAVSEGLVYFRATPKVFPIIERIFLFGFASTAILSLLPLVAKDQLQGEAHIYGLLYGGYGLGAILSGVFLGRLRRRFGVERVVVATLAINAVALVLIALTKSVGIALAASTACGAGWLVLLTLLNSTLQLSTPRRLVGRMVSIFMTFTYLGIAIGGWVWGAMADHFGTANALIAAGLTMGCIVPFSRWRPLPDISGPDPDLPPAAGLS